MHYWLVSFICIFSLSGCGSSSAISDVNDAIDLVEDVSDLSDEQADNISDLTDTAKYSLISCGDDLRDVVALINSKRAQAQMCGETSYPAVDALTWNNLLALAAEEHSDNMANYNFFDHTGKDGSTVGARVTAQGYTWNSVAENIAAGPLTAKSAVDGLMDSPGHCKNIMSSSVTEIGLACTYNSSTTYKTYWTQVFANALQ